MPSFLVDGVRVDYGRAAGNSGGSRRVNFGAAYPDNVAHAPTVTASTNTNARFAVPFNGDVNGFSVKVYRDDGNDNTGVGSMHQTRGLNTLPDVGYKVTDGVMRIWGRSTGNSGGSVRVNFTNPYPNTDYSIIAAPNLLGGSTPLARYVNVFDKDVNGFSFRLYTDDGSNTGVGATWNAIGKTSAVDNVQYKITGDHAEIWGTTFISGTGTVINLPIPLIDDYSVCVVRLGTSSTARRFVVAEPINSTSFRATMYGDTGSVNSGDISWIAVGEVDKTLFGEITEESDVVNSLFFIDAEIQGDISEQQETINAMFLRDVDIDLQGDIQETQDNVSGSFAVDIAIDSVISEQNETIVGEFNVPVDLSGLVNELPDAVSGDFEVDVDITGAINEENETITADFATLIEIIGSYVEQNEVIDAQFALDADISGNVLEESETITGLFALELVRKGQGTITINTRSQGTIKVS